MRTSFCLLAPLLLLACSASIVTPPDAGPAPSDHVDVPGDEGGTATEAGMCCPMEQFPSCECFETGWRDPSTGSCGRICDARATGRAVAPDGCPYWTYGSANCLPSGDVGRE